MTQPNYPIGGFAPGHYNCKCCTCGKDFIGDKRAVQCETCATPQPKDEFFPGAKPLTEFEQSVLNNTLKRTLKEMPTLPGRESEKDELWDQLFDVLLFGKGSTELEKKVFLKSLYKLSKR